MTKSITFILTFFNVFFLVSALLIAVFLGIWGFLSFIAFELLPIYPIESYAPVRFAFGIIFFLSVAVAIDEIKTKDRYTEE